MPLLPEKIRLAPKSEVEGLYDIPTELKGWADEVVHDLRFGQVSEWFDYPRLERAWENPESGVFSDPVKAWKLLSDRAHVAVLIHFIFCCKIFAFRGDYICFSSRLALSLSSKIYFDEIYRAEVKGGFCYRTAGVWR